VAGFFGDNRLFAVFDIDVTGEDKLDALMKKMGMVDQQAEKTGRGMEMVGQGTQNVADSADDAGQQFGKMFGIGMNVLFLGMALNMVFGRMARNMLSMTGASAALGAAMKSVLLPFFIAITPFVIDLATAMMNLPESIKFALGAIVAMIAVVAPLMMLFGQLALIVGTTSFTFASLGLIISGILLTVGALAIAIFFLQRAFKGIQPVVSALAAIVAGTLLTAMSPLLGVLVMLAGAVAGIIGVFKKWGKVAGVIAALIVAVVGSIIAAFVSLPAGIAAVVVAIAATLWSMKDEIAGAIDAAIKFVKGFWRDVRKWFGKAGDAIGRFVDDAVAFLKSLPRKAGNQIDELLGFFKNLGNDIIKAAKGLGNAGIDLAEKLIDGLANGIRNSADMIITALEKALPDWAVSIAKNTAGAFSSGLDIVGSAIGVDDFILSGDKLIKPDKRDTIIGAKPGGPIAEGAGGGEQITVNINDPVMKDDVDVQQLVDEVEERVNRDTRGRSGGLI